MHTSALARYLSASVVSKGLRINLKSETSDMSIANKANWETILKRAYQALLPVITANSLCEQEKSLSKSLTSEECQLIIQSEYNQTSALLEK